MKLRMTCREATRIVLEGEDRKLGAGERMALRLHLIVCDACPRFVRQVALMKGAMERWRHYSTDDNPPN